MSQLLGNVQGKLKTSSTSAFVFVVRLLSAVVLGLTFALIGDEVMGYGTFAFVFVLSMVLLIFLQMTKRWSFGHVLIFDLICILVGTVLRMYIEIAPGA